MEKGSLQSGNTFFPGLAGALNWFTAPWLFTILRQQSA
jgi:hypothetical protein